MTKDTKPSPSTLFSTGFGSEPSPPYVGSDGVQYYRVFAGNFDPKTNQLTKVVLMENLTCKGAAELLMALDNVYYTFRASDM